MLLDRAARRRRARAEVAAPREPAAAPARRADRPRRVVRFTFDGKRVEALRGRHDRLGALRGRPADVLAQLQVPPPRAGCCAAPASARTASSPSTARPASAPAPSRSARDEGRAPERRGRRSSFDVMRATDIVGGPFTPPGFYYKTFIRPRKLWPRLREGAPPRRRPRRAAQAAARARVAHRVPPPPRRRARRRRRDRRARAPRCAAAEHGADVVLVDEGPEPAARLSEAGTTRRALPQARAPASRSCAPGARLLRRDRPGLAGRHAAPDPRRAPRRSPPARSSSRSSSPATTSRGDARRAAPAG